MVTPFDSSAFFEDEFFLPSTATISGKIIKCILIDELDPERHGNLVSRPGHWGMLYVKTADLPVPLDPGTEIIIDGETWRKDSSTDQGDVTEIVVLTDQRKR